MKSLLDVDLFRKTRKVCCHNLYSVLNMNMHICNTTSSSNGLEVVTNTF